MAKITPYVNLKDVHDKFNKLVNCIDNSGVVFEKTLKDMRSRAPGKIADAVRSVYNIKKSDLMPTKEETDLKRAGTIQARGEDIMSFKLIYEGRKLTPLHFGMTPNQRPEKNKYTVKAKIKKGKATVLKPEKDKQVVDGGAIFLAPNPKKPSQILAWERISEYDKNASKEAKRKAKYDIRGKRTMSLPQMVGPSDEGIGGNPIVMKQISDSLSELLDKRFRYHYKKYTGKELKG